MLLILMALALSTLSRSNIVDVLIGTLLSADCVLFKTYWNWIVGKIGISHYDLAIIGHKLSLKIIRGYKLDVRFLIGRH